MKERLFALSILLATTHISSALSTATEIIISVPEQQLAVIDRGKVISKYDLDIEVRSRRWQWNLSNAPRHVVCFGEIR